MAWLQPGRTEDAESLGHRSRFPQERWAGHWRELCAAGSLNFPGRHRHRNGFVSDVEVFAHYFELDGVECVSAVAYPLSPEQRAERALRESEARLALALEVSGQAISEIDLITPARPY